MSTLEHAVEIAARAHTGQVDKSGAPYLLHALRVVLAVRPPPERLEAARCAAALHDVVEDTDWTLDDLRREGFGEDVLAAVDALTRRAGEDYFDYVRRAAADPVARAVKVADLRDNLDRTRIASPTERDEARLARYRAALALVSADDA